jgi:hypothetical protein
MSTFKQTSGSSAQRRKEIRRRVERARKSVIEDTECGNGTFYCNHLYDPEHPWHWVDFRFLSKKNPKKYYFAVAMTTLNYAAIENDEELAYAKLDEIDGPYDIKFEWELIPKAEQKRFGRGTRQIKFDPEAEARLAKRMEIRKSITRVLNSAERIMKPSMTIINEDYRPGCVGLIMTVDEPFLNAEIVEKYIKLFRDNGESTNDGIVWEGTDVKVTPSKENIFAEDSGD